MAAYTVVNLHDVEDSAPKFKMDGQMEARFASGDLALEKSGISLQRVLPDQTQPFGHKHDDQEEVYVVVGGGGQMKLDDDVVDVKQWDAIRVGPSVMRAFSAGSDGLEFLAFGAPAVADLQKTTTMEQGFFEE
jgi:mannose-6-phosphate isomerase-like protein (cupin superfamily)